MVDILRGPALVSAGNATTDVSYHRPTHEVGQPSPFGPRAPFGEGALQKRPMSENKTQVELTSKPIKLWLAVSSIASLICVIGLFTSFGEPTMSTTHWFWATVITIGVHQVFRAARWWEHG